ncbi:hypothetical protein EVAR_9924_1 [Eumeta japonica]|uniref:Uncharacterized protein n=1 Tax=Eumeta variegata TaxID=151549 RepID=A0A4C1TQT0_EUMVA|nr:hypothetical protein EVAR_9924_1 [Eumeta japonica]
MVLTKKLKYDDPVVHMNGEHISSVGEIRLLGLTIDKKLTFIPHVAKACKKAANIYKGLARAAKGDVGSESGDREDHIYYRDRAYRSVRFVRLGTGDEEARRAKDARRCPAQRRS